MRSTWTDSRLDDFAKNTDRRLDELTIRVGELSGRIDSLQHTFIQFAAVLAASQIGVMATILTASIWGS